jgi:hypothetical protein
MRRQRGAPEYLILTTLESRRFKQCQTTGWCSKAILTDSDTKLSDSLWANNSRTLLLCLMPKQFDCASLNDLASGENLKKEKAEHGTLIP